MGHFVYDTVMTVPTMHSYGSLALFVPIQLSSMWFHSSYPASINLAGLDTARGERVSLDYCYSSAASSTDISAVYGSHTILKSTERKFASRVINN